MKHRLLVVMIPLVLWMALPLAAPAEEVDPILEKALDRLYNFAFLEAHAVLDTYIETNPQDPLGHVLRGAVDLTYELDRMGILATEFFGRDENMHADKNARPDPRVRAHLMGTLDRAYELAEGMLEEDENDAEALFAMTLREGLLMDYHGLVEKKGIRSLFNAKRSSRHAERVLELEPEYYDAYLANGVNEYLIGSLPWFLKLFVRIDGVEGDKDVAWDRLTLVAERGTYLAPFARILMSVISLREDRPRQALELLERLSAEYPENKLFRKEAADLRAKFASGELTTAD